MEGFESILQLILSLLGPSVGVGLTICLLIWILRNPEKIEKWLALTKGLRCRIPRGIIHKFKTRAFQKNYKNPLRRINEEMGGTLPKKIKMRFVDPEKYGRDFVEGRILDGFILITKAWDSNISCCFQKMMLAYFRDGAFQRLRHFVNQNYMEGLDIALTLKVLSSVKKKGPLNCFIREVVTPILQRDNDDELRRYFKNFKELEAAGLLTSILARELSYVEKNVLDKLDPKGIGDEAESILVFLSNIRHKARNEKVELTFKGSMVSFHVVPVGNPATKLHGKIPYIDRIKKCLEQVSRVYVWGVGASNAAMIDEISLYDFEGRFKMKVAGEYHTNDSRILPVRVLQIC